MVMFKAMAASSLPFSPGVITFYLNLDAPVTRLVTGFGRMKG
jgi:hypothetical protein